MQEKNKFENLNAEEHQCIMKAMYDLIKIYPEKGSLEVDFEEFEKQSAGLSLCSMQGAVFLEKDITGGFRGLVPFYIIYRSLPKTGRQKLNKIDFLEKLSKWLSSKENYPSFSDGRVVEAIVPECVPYKSSVSGSGTNDYIVTFNLTYRKGGE